jgi:small subunit ribosomal protein S17
MADDTRNETDETEAEGVSADAEALEEQVADEPSAEVADAPAAEAADEPVAATDESAPEDEPAAEADESPAEPEAASSSASPEAKRKRKRLPRSERRQRPQTKREKPATRKPIVRLSKPDDERGRRQERQGTVVSDAMEKTIVVRVDVVKAHPRYKKVVRRSVKFHAHDETSQAKVGDVVRIVETRPLSKTKRWRLAEVVEAAK